MDPGVPLVVPEVNPEALAGHRGIVASPNCSTIQLVVALNPIRRRAGLRRVIVSTYQSVSGTGVDAMAELREQTRQVLDGQEPTRKVYPHQIAFNCLPHIDDFDANGYSLEEMKLVRETRRIVGTYVLTGEDVREGRRFPDAVARGSYLIDIHDPAGTRTTLQQVQAPFYDIPYRALVPKATERLLVAGRCISVDHIAFGSTRVIPTCYATGQAAGTAAALAVRHGVPPRAVDVAELRAAIRAAGGIC